MVKDKKRDKDEAFISYLDENSNRIDTWVEIIEESNSFVKFRTEKNILTIPLYRILKIKRRLEGETK
jgi:uncharacterized protein (UPF0248 family)